MTCDAGLVVFADVEGLLAAAGQPSDPCADALREAAAKGVPVVFCSTRTRAEIEAVQAELGLRHPFVCENGAALWIPAGYFGPQHVERARRVAGYDVVAFGPAYHVVLDRLVRHAAALRIEIVGFHEMAAADIATACGISLAAAERAKQREYGEPFRFVREDAEARTRLRLALEGDGLALMAGEPFDYVGPCVDESAAIDILRRLYRQSGQPKLTVGLGDPLADAALLQRVDIPIAMTPAAPALARGRITKSCLGASAQERRLRLRVVEDLQPWNRTPALLM